MNRRTLLTGIAVTAGTLVLPNTINAAAPKEEWREYLTYEESPFTTVWMHMSTFGSEEEAAQEFKRLATREPNTIEVMEFAGSEFLVTSNETRDRNEVGDESACFDTDYENLDVFVMFARQGNVVVQSTFEVVNSNETRQAVKILEATFKYNRLPSELILLDITGADWFVNRQGGASNCN